MEEITSLALIVLLLIFLLHKDNSRAGEKEKLSQITCKVKPPKELSPKQEAEKILAGLGLSKEEIDGMLENVSDDEDLDDIIHKCLVINRKNNHGKGS